MRSVLVVADSGQIEARVNAWLAGQADKLAMFRKLDNQTDRYRIAFAERARALGHEPTELEAKEISHALAALGIEEGDLYATEGTRYFGRRITKRDTPIERQVAKSMELGLGFGLGWWTFSSGLAKGFLGAPPVVFTNEHAQRFGVDVYSFGDRPQGREGLTCGARVLDLIHSGAARLPYGDLVVHCAVTDHFVRLYRSTNSRIAALWNTMGDLIRIMSEDGPPNVVRTRFGPLEVMRHAIRKPNGLVLHYAKLHRSGGEFKYWGYKDGRMQWIKIYGGLLTENCVQSLARDVVAEQALWVRASGYRVATTTHDEIVCVVPEAKGEQCLADMLRIMRTPPAWCADLPLNASGAVARSYGDAK